MVPAFFVYIIPALITCEHIIVSTLLQKQYCEYVVAIIFLRVRYCEQIACKYIACETGHAGVSCAAHTQPRLTT